MRYFVYALIGVGISTATPYSQLSEIQKTILAIIWPGVMVRDAINALDKAAKEKPATSACGEANHG